MSDRQRHAGKLTRLNKYQTPIGRMLLDIVPTIGPITIASCSICGDPDDTHMYAWKKEPGMAPGRLCEDCADIQQRMYGLPADDEIIKAGD